MEYTRNIEVTDNPVYKLAIDKLQQLLYDRCIHSSCIFNLTVLGIFLVILLYFI